MKRILCVLFFVWAIMSTCAASNDIVQRQAQTLELDKLERAAPRGEFELDAGISFEDGIKKLFVRLGSEMRGVFMESLSCIGVILAISVLASIVGSFYDAGEDKIPKFVGVIAAISVTAAASGNITSLIGMGSGTIESMNTFSKALLPSMAAAVAAGGSPGGAAARYAATVLFSDIALTVISSLLIPLIYTYLAVSTANAAIPGASIGKIADFIQWIVTICLKIIVTLFIGYITITGVVATGVDMVGTKTAGAAISTVVPVVGGILSEAAGAVVAGARILRNAIGVFGMLTILSVCLTPFLILAVNYFTFKTAAALTTPICDTKISELIGRIGSCFGVILGMSASCAFLLFMSILSCMHATGVA